MAYFLSNLDLQSEIIVVTQIIVFILSVCGNVLVIIIIAKTKGMWKSKANKLIFSQSIIDGLASVSLLHAFFLNFQLIVDKTGLVTVSYAQALISTLWTLCSIVVSTYNLVVLNIDRYICVVHPLWHRTRYDLKKLLGMIASAWILGFVVACCIQLPFSDGISGCQMGKYIRWINETYIEEEQPRHNHVCNLYFSISVTFSYILPIIMIVFFYCRIIRTLRQRSRLLTRQCDNSRSGIVQTTRGEYRRWYKPERLCLRTVVTITLGFILCWMPYVIHGVLISVDPSINSNGHFDATWVYLGWQINCSINPFIYAFQHKKFRDAAFELCVSSSFPMRVQTFYSKWWRRVVKPQGCADLELYPETSAWHISVIPANRKSYIARLCKKREPEYYVKIKAWK